jgi:D-glycerate 3-kinase
VSRENQILNPDQANVVAIFEQAIMATRGRFPDRPLNVGICGAQGSGKSTSANLLKAALETRGLKVLLLSLDDFYMTREERRQLASCEHPLFLTRGPPGTHHIALCEELFDASNSSGPFVVPVFDKALDDRLPRDRSLVAQGPFDVVLLEGWCVGARPAADEDLVHSVNSLEKFKDPTGAWRRRINAFLACEYAHLFARLDLLFLLAAPNFEIVAEWRWEQEQSLGRSVRASGLASDGLMSKTQIDAFVLYYERVTRKILREMPSRADLTIYLDEDRRPISLSSNLTGMCLGQG